MIWSHFTGTGFITVDKPPKGSFGFVYEITFKDGMKYIGRKQFWSTRKKRFGKRKIAAMTDKRLKKYEMVTTESNWKEYATSNPTAKKRIERGDAHTRVILCFATNKQMLSYKEEYYLFLNRVIEKKDYYNDNIAGRYYSKLFENGG